MKIKVEIVHNFDEKVIVESNTVAPVIATIGACEQVKQIYVWLYGAGLHSYEFYYDDRAHKLECNDDVIDSCYSETEFQTKVAMYMNHQFTHILGR